MANENKLQTKIELTGAQKSSQDVKQLTTDLQKLAQAAQQVFGSSSGLYSLASLGKQPELVKALRENAKVMQAMTASGKSASNPFLGTMLNQQLGIGAGQNRPGRESYVNFWKSSIPPQIPPPVIQQARNTWKLLLEAAVTGPVSPFGAARALSQAFGGGGFGGKSGSSGGGLFGAGGADMFNLWFSAIRYFDAAVRALVNYMVTQIKAAFNAGAKLYTDAAQAGLAPSKMFAVQRTAQALGMSEAQAQEMVMRSASGVGGRTMGAFKDRSRFQGLNKEAQEFLNYLKGYDEVLNRSTGSIFNAMFSVNKLNVELDMLWRIVAEQLTGGVKSLAEQMAALLRTMNELNVTLAAASGVGAGFTLVAKAFEMTFTVIPKTLILGLDLMQSAMFNFVIALSDIARKIPLVGDMVPDLGEPADLQAKFGNIAGIWKKFFTEGFDNTAPSMEGNRQKPFPMYIPPAGQWEKLGLSFGSNDAKDYARQTADNTYKMVALLNTLVGKVDAGTPYNDQRFANYA